VFNFNYRRQWQGLACVLVLNCLLLVRPGGADAGCGCNKPPPLPAAVIPSVAFEGMTITLFNPAFAVGQSWSVTFTDTSTSVTVTSPVISRRNITDPSGNTRTPQLVLSVPEVLVGPVSIAASNGTSSMNIPASDFVVLGRPIAVAETNQEINAASYSMAVGLDGTLWVGIAGLARVCDPIEIDAQFKGYPLQFGFGDVSIINLQGFFIDTLNSQSAGHVSFQAADDSGTDSTKLIYFRHDFEQYCKNHLIGGSLQVDPLDTNWHLVGSPHVDYSTLFFAIAGKLPNGSTPPPGLMAANLTLTVTTYTDAQGLSWEPETNEEGVSASVPTPTASPTPVPAPSPAPSGD